MSGTVRGTRVSVPRTVLVARYHRVLSSFDEEVRSRKLSVSRCFRFANVATSGVVRSVGPRTLGEVRAELILRGMTRIRGVRPARRRMGRRVSGVTRTCGVRTSGLGRLLKRHRLRRVGGSVTMRGTIAIVTSTTGRIWFWDGQVLEAKGERTRVSASFKGGSTTWVRTFV